MTTALLDDGEWNDEDIGLGEADGEPSCNVQLRWLKTENKKKQGNGSGNFFTSTWSSAIGRGQLRQPLARLRRLHSKLGEIQNKWQC